MFTILSLRRISALIRRELVVAFERGSLVSSSEGLQSRTLTPLPGPSGILVEVGSRSRYPCLFRPGIQTFAGLALGCDPMPRQYDWCATSSRPWHRAEDWSQVPDWSRIPTTGLGSSIASLHGCPGKGPACRLQLAERYTPQSAGRRNLTKGCGGGRRNYLPAVQQPHKGYTTSRRTR